MRKPTFVAISGAALLLCACGGSDKESATPLPPQTATDAALSFLLVEQSPATPSALPTWTAAPDGKSFSFSAPTLAQPGCATGALVSNPDGSNTLTLTFACTNVAEGSSLTGSVAYTFSAASPGSYRVAYQNLKAARGTQSWAVTGSKQITLNLVGQKAAVSTLEPMVVTVVNGANTRVLTYTCNLTGDWGTVGLYKVSGGFSLQSGSELPVTCTITTPLTWDTVSGCCHPISGLMALVQGQASATVSFMLPCGTYQVSGIQTFAPSTLPACPN